MIRSQKLTVRVFRFSEDTEWHKVLMDTCLIHAGRRWCLIRANYKKRSMVMIAGKYVKSK